MPECLIDRLDIDDPVHGPQPGVVVRPQAAEWPLPLCLFLYGGGGSCETLTGLAPVLDRWWSQGLLPPMLVATPEVGPWSFYLDDPARGMGWESFVAERFIPEVCARWRVGARLGVVGVSMGGYGALKLAFARPACFAAVAAVSPMVEPVFEAGECPLRNRYHYPAEVPQALLGPNRDPELYRADHPANRARRRAAELRDSDLAISIDAAGDDAFHAQDGAEFVHRVLWDLDVHHEYRLRRDADHIGPSFLDQLLDAFRWNASRLAPPEPAPLNEAERVWQRWLDQPESAMSAMSAGSPTPAAPLPPTSRIAPAALRKQVSAARTAAAQGDATFDRRCGRLPDPR